MSKTAELERVSEEDLARWLVYEGFARPHDSASHRLVKRLMECWVIHYVPHCGCSHHGDSAGCDPRCEEDGECSCKFEVRKIR